LRVPVQANATPKAIKAAGKHIVRRVWVVTSEGSPNMEIRCWITGATIMMAPTKIKCWMGLFIVLA
jgi:hypothetical protein